MIGPDHHTDTNGSWHTEISVDRLRDGFLGFKTSFMLDAVVCALVIIVPVLLWSLFAVRFRRRYAFHRRLQIVLGLVLFLAVGAFEVDLQWIQGGWENVLEKQELPPEQFKELTSRSRVWLRIHLLFAVTTPLLWITTLTLALRRFSNPPTPGSHSGLHKILGWASTVDITLTAVTGLTFYYVAFVAGVS